MARTMSIHQIEQRHSDEIVSRGFAVEHLNTERGPASYTVGLTEQGLPELIVWAPGPIGLAACVRVATTLVSGLLPADLVRGGAQLSLQAQGPCLQVTSVNPELMDDCLPMARLRQLRQGIDRARAEVLSLSVQSAETPGGAPVVPLPTLGEVAARRAALRPAGAPARELH